MSAFDPQVIAAAASVTAQVAETGGLISKACQIAKTHPIAAAATGVVVVGLAAWGGYKAYQHFTADKGE